MLIDFEANRDERMQKVAALLLKNRTGTEDWGEISRLGDNPCTKHIANKFLICCLLDYQIDTKLAWRNGCRLVKEILHDPEDVWLAINSVSQDEWGSKFKEYHLHRFPNAHNRLWRFGKDICNRYDGDARKIWQNKGSGEVLESFLSLNAGEQISRMIVGALLDCRQIRGSGDVKADLHVCRALGRIFYGAPTNHAAALELARQLNPSDPWELDQPLWKVGKSYCHPDAPNCSKCYLISYCTYAYEHTMAS
jgi:hypothetical protein